MTPIDLWNSSVAKTWPYSSILEGLKIEGIPCEVALFILDSPEKIDTQHTVNWQRIASVASLIDIDQSHEIPTSPTEFVSYIISVINAIRNQNKISVEKFSEELYSISTDIRKRLPFPGVVGLLDQIFTCVPKIDPSEPGLEGSDPDPEGNPEGNPEDPSKDYIYDIDLYSFILKTVPRLYSSELLNICSNNIFNFVRYYYNKTPITPETELLLVEMLETTRKGAKYVNLDKMARIIKKTAAKMKYSDDVLRIASDDERLFTFVQALAGKYRTPPSPKAEKTSVPSGPPVPSPMGKRKPIPKKIRDDLWKKEFYPYMDGVCHCCGNDIDIYNWEAGHIIAAAKGGPDSIDNLRPVCKGCNRSMGTRNMDEYINEYRLPGPPKVKALPIGPAGPSDTKPKVPPVPRIVIPKGPEGLKESEGPFRTIKVERGTGGADRFGNKGKGKKLKGSKKKHTRK